MSSKKLTLYSLQIAISTLFIIITVTLGAVISLQNYNKTSDIILSSADKVYAQIAQELALDFKATYRPMAGILQLLSQSEIKDTTTLEQRLQYLGLFNTLLKTSSSYFTSGITFPDGDTFVTTLLNNELVRSHYKAPEAAALLVLYVETDNTGSRHMLNIFFDENLREISKSSTKSNFDPLQRNWYKQAKDTPSATKPYLFYDIEIVGLTAMLKTNKPGVVVSIGITLDNLSNTISKYQVTPNTEVVLINAKGETYAYKDTSQIIVKSDNKPLQLATLQKLDSKILNYVGKNFEPIEQQLDFEFSGIKWIGSSKIISRPGGIDLYAVMVSPVDELLVEATALRWQSLMMTLAIILFFIPVIWFAAKKISNPLKSLAIETEKIARFEFDESLRKRSFIKEIEELDSAMNMMRTTINKFIKLIATLAGEQDLDALLKSITYETKLISKANGALTYLLDETDNSMKPAILFSENDEPVSTELLPELSPENLKILLADCSKSKSSLIHLNSSSNNILKPLLQTTGSEELNVLVVPLSNRNDETVGLLCVIYDQSKNVNRHTEDDASIAFIEALSGFAAVTLEGRQMLHMQEALLNSFIKLIAGAIDAKSPYTGGHCQRVPEITFMLAKSACDSTDSKFKDFSMNDKQWQELEIACWLHDCGKVTTPEYVVDKSTKLETIYDRIHEVRMRFEVLKRDSEIHYWQQLSEGVNKDSLKEELEKELKALDDDFDFIAECNEGGEFMADDKIERLNEISKRTWFRTLDDRIGISWEENNRKNRTDKVALPVEEKLLSDKAEHIIERNENDCMPADNKWNFKLDTPEHKYNRGEIYNLAIQRGTLSNEERFKINDHMVQTIIMLKKLPYPKHLKNVPEIAGCHHETLDGKGYPKKLTKEQTPVTGRMMAIADIFEALTASDRPYKKAKKLSEAIRILGFMKKDNHIDPDLFELFLNSGVHMEYAKKFLKPEQIDEVDISQYMSS